MGRRKKEPKSVHREKIATVASALFMEKGITTSMDDIAKAAGYSKATLYVYFENKEEIVGILVLNSMKKLYDYIASALAQQETTKERKLISPTKLKTMSTFCTRFPSAFSGAWTMIFLIN